MSATWTFSTDANPPDEDVVAKTFCYSIEVFEDAGGATLSFKITESGGNAITYPPGAMHVFRRGEGQPFRANEKVGKIAAIGGSLTMAQRENPRP